jgi:hypothetical protein
MKNEDAKSMFAGFFEGKVQNALSAQLNKQKFKGIGYPAGFHYGITYGNNAYFNAATLEDLDRMLEPEGESGVGFSIDTFSGYYYKLLCSTLYEFSDQDNEDIAKETENAASKVETLITAYADAGYQCSDPNNKLRSIMKDLKGQSKDDMGAQLYGAYMAYRVASAKSAILYDLWVEADALLEAAKKNLTTPTADNGGMQVSLKGFYAGYSPESLPTAGQIVESLNNDGSSIKLSFSADNFSSDTASVHIENKSTIVIPYALFFDIVSEQKVTYDWSKTVVSDSSVSIDITYPGVTLLSAIPSVLSIDNATGWYSPQVISDLAEKSGDKTKTGYKLQGSEFSAPEIFGESKKFSRLKTFVISRPPTIKMTMSKVDVNTVTEALQVNHTFKVNLFDFINIDGTSNNYTVSDIKSDEAAQSVTVTFSAPPVSSATIEKQTAFVLGGVPQYPSKAQGVDFWGDRLGWMKKYETLPDRFPGVVSIDTGARDENNKPTNLTYSPDFSNCRGCLAIIPIIMGANSRVDFTMANTARGQAQPANTTWHHLFMLNSQNNACHMQLVSTSFHQSSCPHRGGNSQRIIISNASGREPLFKVDEAKVSAMANSLQTADDRLSAHETESGITLPKDVKQFYLFLAQEDRSDKLAASSADHPVRKLLERRFDSPEMWIAQIYPPDQSENGIFGILKNEETAVNRAYRQFANGGSIPFAENGVGDIFYRNKDGLVCYYDHEFVNEPTCLHIRLADLLK